MQSTLRNCDPHTGDYDGCFPSGARWPCRSTAVFTMHVTESCGRLHLDIPIITFPPRKLHSCSQGCPQITLKQTDASKSARKRSQQTRLQRWKEYTLQKAVTKYTKWTLETMVSYSTSVLHENFSLLNRYAYIYTSHSRVNTVVRPVKCAAAPYKCSRMPLLTKRVRQ